MRARRAPSSPRCRTAARAACGCRRLCLRASRSGWPSVRRLARSVRLRSTRLPCRLSSWRRVRRSGVASRMPVISRWSWASSCGSRASKLRPASRSSSLAMASGTWISGASSLPGPSPRAAAVAWPRSSGSPSPGRAEPGSRVSGVGCRVSGVSGASSPTSPAGLPNTSSKTASKAPACVRSETNTPLAVQYRRRRETGRTSVSASRERRRPLGRDRHARLVQAPAEGGRQRRQVELDRLDPERARVSHGSARAARARPRGSPPGPRCT